MNGDGGGGGAGNGAVNDGGDIDDGGGADDGEDADDGEGEDDGSSDCGGSDNGGGADDDIGVLDVGAVDTDKEEYGTTDEDARGDQGQECIGGDVGNNNHDDGVQDGSAGDSRPNTQLTSRDKDQVRAQQSDTQSPIRPELADRIFNSSRSLKHR